MFIIRWFKVLLETKPTENEEQILMAYSDAFDFWHNGEEDIYQDYLQKQ